MAQATLSVNASNSIVCPGDTIALSASISGGTGPYSFFWRGSGQLSWPNSDTINYTVPEINGPDSIFVTGIDLGSTDTLTGTIVLDVHGIFVNLGNDTTISCADSLALVPQVGGDTTGFGYTWNNNAQTSTISGIRNGLYAITVYNTQGCQDIDSMKVSISVNQQISYAIGTVINTDTFTVGTNTTCQNRKTIFTNISTSVAGWDWEWNYGRPDQIISLNPSPFTHYPNTGVFTLTTTATNGSCILQAQHDITVLPEFSTTCGGDEGPIDHPWPIGIDEPEQNLGFDIVPNPANDVVTLHFERAAAHQVFVYNSVGQLWYQQKGHFDELTIETGDWPVGCYFVQSENGPFSKLIVTR